jgi:protein TonB
MTQTADNVIVDLGSLRFKPANSNRQDRSVVSHQFNNVPRCSYARDDGISPYLGAETRIDPYPASAVGLEPLHADIPHPAPDLDKPLAGARRKLLRSGFALSIFLHASVAAALGFIVAKTPDEALLQGEMVVSLIVQGDDSDVDARVAGDETAKDLEVEEPQQEIVQEQPEPDPKPVEPPPVAKAAPESPPVAQATAEQLLKDAPLPMLGAPLPDILTATTPAAAKVEEIAKPIAQQQPEPIEEIKPEPPKPVEPPKVETKPVEDKKPEPPTPVEKKPELRKPDPKPVVETEKPKKTVKKTAAKKEQKKRKGQKTDQDVNADRGRTDAKNKGKSAKDASRGAANREVGNAAADNYKGLVEKRLSRAQKRVRHRGEGSLVLSFTITADGGVSGARVSRSSGDPKLDQAGLTLLAKASPFPPIPAETGRKSWKMTVPIDFR